MCDEHAKLCAPVPKMVYSEHIVAQKLHQPTNALAYDCWPDKRRNLKKKKMDKKNKNKKYKKKIK